MVHRYKEQDLVVSDSSRLKEHVQLNRVESVSVVEVKFRPAKNYEDIVLVVCGTNDYCENCKQYHFKFNYFIELSIVF